MLCKVGSHIVLTYLRCKAKERWCTNVCNVCKTIFSPLPFLVFCFKHLLVPYVHKILFHLFVSTYVKEKTGHDLRFLPEVEVLFLG